MFDIDHVLIRLRDIEARIMLMELHAARQQDRVDRLAAQGLSTSLARELHETVVQTLRLLEDWRAALLTSLQRTEPPLSPGVSVVAEAPWNGGSLVHASRSEGRFNEDFRQRVDNLLDQVHQALSDAPVSRPPQRVEQIGQLLQLLQLLTAVEGDLCSSPAEWKYARLAVGQSVELLNDSIRRLVAPDGRG